MKISKVRLFVIQKQNNSPGTHLDGIVVWKSAYEGELDVEMTTIHLFTVSTTHQPDSLKCIKAAGSGSLDFRNPDVAAGARRPNPRM